MKLLRSKIQERVAGLRDMKTIDKYDGIQLSSAEKFLIDELIESYYIILEFAEQVCR